jgi:hypothetical protein
VDQNEMATEVLDPWPVDTVTWNRQHAEPFLLAPGMVPVLYVTADEETEYIVTGIHEDALWGRAVGQEEVDDKNHPITYLTPSVNLGKRAFVLTRVEPDEYPAAWTGENNAVYALGDANGLVLIGGLPGENDATAQVNFYPVAAGANWKTTDKPIPTVKGYNALPVATNFIPYADLYVYPLVARIVALSDKKLGPAMDEGTSAVISSNISGSYTHILANAVLKNGFQPPAQEGGVVARTVVELAYPFPNLVIMPGTDPKTATGVAASTIKRLYDQLRTAQEESEGGGASGSLVLPGNAPSPTDDDDEAVRAAEEAEAARVAAEAARIAEEAAARQAEAARAAAQQEAAEAARAAEEAELAAAELAVEQAAARLAEEEAARLAATAAAARAAGAKTSQPGLLARGWAALRGSPAGEPATTPQQSPAQFSSGLGDLTPEQAQRLGQVSGSPPAAAPGSRPTGTGRPAGPSVPPQPSGAPTVAEMERQLANDQEMPNLTARVRTTSAALVQAADSLAAADGLIEKARTQATIAGDAVRKADVAWGDWIKTHATPGRSQGQQKNAAVRDYDTAAGSLGAAVAAAAAAERQISAANVAHTAFETAETGCLGRARMYDPLLGDRVREPVRAARDAAADAWRRLAAALPRMPDSSAALQQQRTEMTKRAADLRASPDAPPDVLAVAPIVVATDPAEYIASEGTFVDVSFELTINGSGARLRPRVMRSAGGNGFGVMIAHLGGDKYNFGVSGQPRILRIAKGGAVDVDLVRVGGKRTLFHHVIPETRQDRAVAEMIPSAAGRGRGMYLQYTVRGGQLRSLVVAVVGIPAKDL